MLKLNIPILKKERTIVNYTEAKEKEDNENLYIKFVVVLWNKFICTG